MNLSAIPVTDMLHQKQSIEKFEIDEQRNLTTIEYG